ncbi:hypothetical protein [Candidatus Tisiphia endosymbiont of Parasteatoda lunata]|uniref:hypothetical protein n=1 Tax=Candidatus Tisiphia endosymbiont of Parasteatoda lunata TaxID=3066275 RepID=UPI00313D5E17
MPIENIIKSQKQGKLFGYKLKEELNSNNKLYKLRELINWSGLEKWLSKNVSIKETGLIFQDKFFTNFVSHFT